MKPPEVIAAVFLIYASLVDIRTKEIDPVVTAVTALTGAVYVCLERSGDLRGVALSLLPGFSLFLFGLISRGRFGAGDGLTIMTIGLFLSADAVLVSVMAGLLLSSCFAAGVLIAGRKRHLAQRGSEVLPFLPFLLGGYSLCLVLNV